MFPKAATNNRQYVDRNYNDLDSLISELNEEKEQISSSGTAGTQRNAGGGSDIVQPVSGEPYYDEEITAKLSDEAAEKSGRVMAETVDTAVGTGCSIYSGNNTPEKYQASDKQKALLSENWAAVAKKHGMKLENNPELILGLNTLAIYFPKIKDARHDRQINELRDQMDEIRAEIEQLKEERTRVKSQPEKKE